MKDELLQDIENARFFREQKAEEYPEDDRNRKSADALKRLAEYVTSLPGDHRLFEAYRRVYQESEDDDAPIRIMEDVLGRIPGEPDELTRFGFDSDDDPAEWIESFTDNLMSAWAEHGFQLTAVETRH